MASNVTKVAVVSHWNGLDGLMGRGGHVRRLDLVMGAMPSAQWVRNDGSRGSFFFCLKSPFLRVVQQHVLGLQCLQSGCDFRLEWFIRINGTWLTCRIPRFGDGDHARCSMGSTLSLERVFFSLKSPFLRGVQRHVLGLQCHKSDCDFWLEWFV